MSAPERVRAKIANHEGAVEQVQPSGLSSLSVRGWARDLSSSNPNPVQVQILVGVAVRATVTANLRRPDGSRNGFAATVRAPSQPALVCARTVAKPQAGVMLGCKQLPFGVPIRVVAAAGQPTPSGQVASFFWIDARGDVAKELGNVPIVNGVALYDGEPLARTLSWALTVHDPGSGPLFRSGPLVQLPGPASGAALTERVDVYRSSTTIAFDLTSEEGGLHLVIDRLRRLPWPIRFESVRLGGDTNGHEVVTVTGRLWRFPIFRRFTYTLRVALRPATAPGRPADVVVAVPAGPATGTGVDVSRHAAVLDAAILEGVKRALDASVTRIARLELERLGIGFAARFVSVTSVEVRPLGTDARATVRLHAGTITSFGDVPTEGPLQPG